MRCHTPRPSYKNNIDRKKAIQKLNILKKSRKSFMDKIKQIRNNTYKY